MIYSNDLIKERLVLSVTQDGNYKVTDSNSQKYHVGSQIAQSELNTLLHEGVQVVMGAIKEQNFNGGSMDGRSVLLG